jgi:hypothetical protein
LWLLRSARQKVRKADESRPAKIFLHRGGGRTHRTTEVIPCNPEILTRTRKPDFKALFRAVPGLYLVLRPDLTIVDASDGYLHATMTWRNEIRGAQVFDVFPENPSQPKTDDIRNLNASLARVLSSGRPDTLDIQKYDVRDQVSKEGSWPEKYWVPMNFPVFGHQSRQIAAVINRVEHVNPVRPSVDQGTGTANEQTAMKQLREERVIRGKPLGAEEEFKATLFRAVREQLHVHKLGVPPEVGVSSYLLPGALVPVSAIYDKFQEPGFT